MCVRYVFVFLIRLPVELLAVSMVVSSVYKRLCVLVSIGGHNITNLRFVDESDRVAGSEGQLMNLAKCLDETFFKYGT